MKLIVKTPADLATEAEAAARARVAVEARRYLAETDWMVVRAAETGQPIPRPVLTARADARRILSEQLPG